MTCEACQHNTCKCVNVLVPMVCCMLYDISPSHHVQCSTYIGCSDIRSNTYTQTKHTDTRHTHRKQAHTHEAYTKPEHIRYHACLPQAYGESRMTVAAARTLACPPCEPSDRACPVAQMMLRIVIAHTCRVP